MFSLSFKMAKMNVVYVLVFAGALLFCSVNGGGNADFWKPKVNRTRPSLGIVDGYATTIKKFPFMASITTDGEFSGAGAILSNSWVLTTAFNVEVFDSTTVFRVGSNYHDEKGQVFGVKKTIKHSDYHGNDFNNDIALVKLNGTIEFGKTAKAIQLGYGRLKKGTKATVAGWGPTTFVSWEMFPADTLVKGVLTIADNSSCGETAQDLICVRDSTTTPCGVDFGDPLVVKNKLYGIFVGNEGCIQGTTNYFANVTYFYDWIQEKMKS